MTAALLERELLGRRGWIGKRREKLLRTVAAIDQLLEPVGEFQLRRVDFWIERGMADDEPLKAWAVMRSAGLRSDALALIEQRISAFRQRDAAQRSA